MKKMFEFLSDDDAFTKWRTEEYDGRYILDHVWKATELVMERELSDAQRHYISAHIICDMSIEAISAMYGVSEYTVTRIISSGRKKLMHELRYTAPWLLNAELEKVDKRRKK